MIKFLHLCLIFLVIADSSDSGSEIWHLEEDDLHSSFDSTSPPDIKITKTDPKSVALSEWIIYFLMLMRMKFKLSDAALSFFLKFLAILFSILGSCSNLCSSIAKSLPSSLHRIRSFFNFVTFTRFAVCKKCHSLYHINECQRSSVSKRCAYVYSFSQPFPASYASAMWNCTTKNS